MIHRINVFILSLLIAISPIILMNQANAAVGGWTMSNPVAQGASTVYDGTKQVIIDGKNYIKKGTAIVTPTATGVAKVLAKGVAGVALSVAVEQLIGAVDWVLDPANNQIKYSSPDQPIPTYQYIWFWNAAPPTSSGLSHIIGSTPEASCAALASIYNETFSHVSKKVITSESQGSAQCNWSSGSYQNVKIYPNPLYNPTAEKEEKTIPLETVAQQVISNAEGNTDKKAGAQVATGAAAADIVAEAEADQTGVKARPIVDQLTGSASTKPADEAAAAQDATATGTAQPKADPVTGEAAPPTDIALKFPMLCGLMPVVCEAAQVVVVRVPEAIEAVKEWVKPEEPVERETKVDVEPSPVAPSETNYLQWNAYCPFSAKSDDISLNGENSTLSSDLTSWCTMASEIKPFVLLAGALASLMIVSGVGLGRSED